MYTFTSGKDTSNLCTTIPSELYTIYNFKHESWHSNYNDMDTSNKGNQNCQYYQRSLW